MMGYDVRIDEILAAKAQFDNVILRNPDVTPREVMEQWEWWKQRWGKKILAVCGSEKAMRKALEDQS